MKGFFLFQSLPLLLETLRVPERHRHAQLGLGSAFIPLLHSYKCRNSFYPLKPTKVTDNDTISFFVDYY